VIAKKTLMLVK
jgi:hypothetical protein